MLSIRKAKPGDELGIAEVHVASWMTTYSGLIPESYIATRSLEKRVAMWTSMLRQTEEAEGKKAVFVCQDESGKIHGFVAGGAEREPGCEFDAELYAIYLDHRQQRRGLGRRLTLELVLWLRQHGYKRMRLWVLEKNPARRFYESIGGKLLPQSKTVDFGGAPCLEVAYGWDDLALLERDLNPSPDTASPAK